ncbi:baseplate J/gp47 family protein [Methanobrevibacter olleyae]|uniref:Phage baseplate assembly protein n=1 Tax=Methanobrevibacter olleyae TaxID=294671 RepID=A0A126R225_METOL|nr:baseplate J/gp47 family protein [Methanobrevibacter olleyae]AMK16331.1 phage baseplate assembly protein [Methanobrevibacter olleyae]
MVEEDTEFITFDGDIIIKSDIRDEIINKYIQANLDGLTKITDFTIGSEAYHITDLMASLVLEHRELIDLNYRMSMIHMMEGEFLDNYGDPMGVHRYGSSPSVGEVTFTRLNQWGSDVIVIPDGLVVSTDDAISFLVDNNGENIILEDGNDSVTCGVICEQEGAYTNVVSGSIKLIMNDLANLLSVTNISDFTGGADIEDDDDYRARILLSPYSVPAGTLGWFENVSLTLDSVHDVCVEKGVTSLDRDIKIIFNPNNWEDIVTRLDINQYNEDNLIESSSTGVMLKARADLVDLWSMNEYNPAGISLDYILCHKVPVLSATSQTVVYFALILETNYTIGMVKDEVIGKIEQFNNDALIGNEFNPNSLASVIENEVIGVYNCRIVEYNSNTDKYRELVETVNVGDNELYNIDLTNINERVKLMKFNLDVELEEGG